MAEKNKKHEKVLAEAKKRFAQVVEYESENRELALDDINFRHGDQWDARDKKNREADGRPCLTINKLEQRVDQVTGDQRMNRMGALIRPLDSTSSHSDTFTLAQIIQGLIKNIEAVSNAKTAYDTGFDHAVGHGFGFWRIITEFSDDSSFDQDIKIKGIDNAMRVYLDPSAEEATKKDAMWGFITVMEDKEKYPEGNWEAGTGEDRLLWVDGEKVRIAEYFRRVAEEIIIWQLDGKAFKVKDGDMDIRDEIMEQFQLAEKPKERKVESYKVEWFKMSMSEIYEEKEFPSKYIPIIPCYGKVLNVRGKNFYRGVIRYAKDPQRIYNYTRTASVEQASLAPKAPWVMEESQLGNHKQMWENANVKNYSVLPYKNVAGVAPPMRQAPPQPSAAWLSESSIADQDIDAASGLYKASLGAPSNERSGKAISERKMEGDVGTFHFHDNRAQSLQHTYEILVDMIPRVYDTERVVRIQKFDDKEEMVEVNKTIIDRQTGEVVKVYDLSMGKFDVAVDVGASYTTQRQQSAESMMELIQYAPSIAERIMPIIAKALDWHGADEIAEVLKDNRPTPEQVQQQIQEAVTEASNSAYVDNEKFKALTARIKVLGEIQDADDKLEVELLKILNDSQASDEEVRGRINQLVQQMKEDEMGLMMRAEQGNAQPQPVQQQGNPQSMPQGMPEGMPQQ